MIFYLRRLKPSLLFMILYERSLSESEREAELIVLTYPSKLLEHRAEMLYADKQCIKDVTAKNSAKSIRVVSKWWP